MISFVARSSGLGPHLTAVRQTLPSGIRPTSLGYERKEKKITHLKYSYTLVEDLSAETHTNFRAAKHLPESGALGSRGPRVTRSLAGTDVVLILVVQSQEFIKFLCIVCSTLIKLMPSISAVLFTISNSKFHLKLSLTQTQRLIMNEAFDF